VEGVIMAVLIVAAVTMAEMQESFPEVRGLLQVAVSAFMLPSQAVGVEVNLLVVPLGVLGGVHQGHVLVGVFLQELWELVEMAPSMVVEGEEVITVVEEAVGRLVEEEDPVIVLELVLLLRSIQDFRTVTVM
jgi:hypothetical protein